MSLIKKALLRDKLEGAGGQSDWNQNDTTANDYIKNKPFGDILVEREYIFETENVTTLNGTHAYTLSCDAFDGNGLVAGQKYDIYYTQSLKGDSTVWIQYTPTNNNGFIAETDENGTVYLGSPSVNGSYPFYFSSEVCAVNYMWVNQFTYAKGVKLVGVFVEEKKLDEKYLPQVQADWDETDETSPAFIMNKPESLGGYAYYYINAYSSGSGLLRSTNEEFDDWSNPVESSEEFFNTYYAKPIMLRVRTSGSDVFAPCIGYSINSGKLYLNYMLNNSITLVNTKLTMGGSTSTSTSTST